jgi:dienelactone hydrolase
MRRLRLGMLVPVSARCSWNRRTLLVMPNWLGVTENAIKRAQKMAGGKYVAFVGCMYGEGQDLRRPADLAGMDGGGARRSRRMAQGVNAALATMVSEANKRDIGDSSKKAAVGFCFGGGGSVRVHKRQIRWTATFITLGLTAGNGEIIYSASGSRKGAVDFVLKLPEARFYVQA